MRVTIPKRGDDPNQPGPWWTLGKPHSGDHWPYPLACCPNGHRAGMSDHTVANDGVVTPSLVCPIDGCGWHVIATFGGWRS